MNTKKIIMCTLTALVSISIIGLSCNFAFSASKSKYKTKKEAFEFFSKQKAKNETQLNLPNTTRKSNKDSKNLKSFYQLFKCENELQLEEKLNESKAKIMSKELLTYEEFIDKYYAVACIDYSFSPDRMIWISVVHYPKGIYSMKGKVENAIVTSYYDAETGENIGFKLKSLDENGMKIQSPTQD